MSARSLVKPPLHYAYIVAGVAFVLLIAAAGVRSSPTMLIQPLEKEFGWTPATISAAIAVNIGLFGLIGPFAAGIFERFGVRRTVAAALALLATGAALSSFMTQPWQFFLLWGLMAGVGTGSIGLVAGATIVNRWFEKNRGTAMGVLTAANATGQLVFLPLFGVLVTRSGWRTEVLFIAAVCAILVPVTLFFVREHPSDMNLPMLGATEVVAPVRSGINPFVNAIGALRTGLRSRDFWLLSGSFFICGASTNGLIGTHLVPACGDHGIPEVQAAGLLAAMGVFDLIGTTASGWLSDRYSSRWLLFWYYGLRGLSLIFLPTAFGAGDAGLTAVRGVLRPRLDCDGPAHAQARDQRFRTRDRRDDVRLDPRGPPARRRRDGIPRRPGPHVDVELRRGVHHVRDAVHDRSADGAVRRPLRTGSEAASGLNPRPVRDGLRGAPSKLLRWLMNR